MDTVSKVQRERLVEAAVKVRSNAYCPASHFPVGCALLSSDGNIYVGCNVENPSFPCGTCAEVGAVANAIAHGSKRFIAAAVTSEVEETVTPCGQCRQVLAEFMPGDSPIILVNKSGKIEEIQLNKLLPYSFKLELLPGHHK